MNAATATATAPPPAEVPPQTADPHERVVEEREAYEYWGYLFKADKTGTDKLKGLLRGLKDIIARTYTPSDQPDLLPSQLAAFYRELHGNYDQLFLVTPHESIAFIYKSLGCLHSLQPAPTAAANAPAAFSDPTVPALKTEGWIMWQTIQLLLGPEEHSGFLTEAVQKWDVRNPATGEPFPKILPRRCFPAEPDKHMVAWYEGVSERLKAEAEAEAEKERLLDAEREDMHRSQDRKHLAPRGAVEHTDDDDGSVDSRGPALAYFRNPLYRHVDGRPSIVRRGSKRPSVSPRPTSGIVEKGKGAATTVGHVIRNIGSPHLWDGGRSSSRPSSRDCDRDRRRRSLPDHRHPHHYPDDPPPGPTSGDSVSSYETRNRHRRSAQMDAPPPPDDDWDADESSSYHSPRPSQHHGRQHRPHLSRESSHLRHSRSHEPTPSQKEYTDYFQGYDRMNDDRARRNSSHSNHTTGTPPENNAGGFAPSASPLFATHVARQPPAQQSYPPPPPPPSISGPPPLHHPSRGNRNEPRISSVDPHARARRSGGPYAAPPDADRRRSREYNDGPRYYESGSRSPHGSARRTRFEQSPMGFREHDPPLPRMDGRSPSRSWDESRPYPPPPPPTSMHAGGGAEGERRWRHAQRQRRSGSDGVYHSSSGPEEGASWVGRPKQTRFAGEDEEGGGRGREPLSGVDGRRYADASPWR